MGFPKLLQRHVKHFLFDLLVVFPIALIIYLSLQPHLSNLCSGSANSVDTHFNDLLVQSLQLPSHGQANCTNIITGIAEYAVTLYKRETMPVSEKHILNMTADCALYKVRRKFIPIPLSKEEEDFPIAFAMVVHENIEMFERLLRAIYAPQNIYCVHVDDKSPDIYKQAVRAIVSCFDNVFVASKLERVVYASWLRVQADLNCMEDLLKSDVRWRYLLNTCGTDFPLKTNAEIVRSLLLLNGKNSMESERPSEHKKGRWRFHYNVTTSIYKTEIEKSPPPIETPMFTGNAYYIVLRAFVDYIFQKGTVVEKLLDWVKDTYSPDEHLWATLNRMPEVPGSSPHNDKYEMSDMNAIARLTKWEPHEGNVNEGAVYSPCTGIHRSSVCVFGAGDLKWILQQHHLFANKFDPAIDDTAIQCLEEYLRLKALYGMKNSSNR